MDNRLENLQVFFWGLALNVPPVYLTYRYLAIAPNINIDNQSIRFNDKTFAWTGLKKIELTGRHSYTALIEYPREATTLVFQNGEIKHIFDSMYRNTAEMKLFLKQILIDKNEFIKIETQPVDRNEISNELLETFPNKPLFNIPGLLLLCSIVFVVLKNARATRPPSLWVLIGIPFFFAYNFLIYSYKNNYFQLGTSYFVIKNLVYFRKIKAYRLRDIQEVVFLSNGGTYFGIKITTKDFKHRYHSASTIGMDNFIRLKNCFQQYHIPVRDN